MGNTVLKNTNEPQTIFGVELKELVSYPDSRGFFRELIRKDDPCFAEGFAQWSHSKMAQNTLKAWHFHHRQIDWWYCPSGALEVVLYDNREESPTYQSKMEFLLGDSAINPDALSVIVRIPQGVLHGCKVLSDSADLFYITSQTYDPEDEGRLPFDTKEVPHNWGSSGALIISERDRTTHIPPYEREPLKTA